LLSSPDRRRGVLDEGVGGTGMNHHQLPGVAQGSGEQWRRRPPPRYEQGGRGRDRGWTVFEIPSTPGVPESRRIEDVWPRSRVDCSRDSVVLVSAPAPAMRPEHDAVAPEFAGPIHGGGSAAKTEARLVSGHGLTAHARWRAARVDGRPAAGNSRADSVPATAATR